MKKKEHLGTEKVKKLAEFFALTSMEWSAKEWAIFNEVSRGVIELQGAKEEVREKPV